MDYKEAIEYLYSMRLFGTKLGLANTRYLLEALGHPEREFFTIHVAGTNGKGSVCALANSILSTEGYRVGVFTSPHILSFRERIRIGQAMISKEEVCRHLAKLMPIIQETSENPELSHPTFFEIVTALAVDYFAASDVNIGIVETGMGGRLDATNALPSQVAAITTIGLEHTAYLGNSIEEVASEKAGIIKEGATVVVGEDAEAAVGVICEAAASRKARVIRFGEDITVENRELRFPAQQLDITCRGKRYAGIELHLLGRHQGVNCGVAVGLIEELRSRGFEIRTESLYRGIKEARCPGRFEVVPGRPMTVLDAACNPHACEALAETLREVAKGAAVTLVAGFLGDKDYRTMCEILVPMMERVILTQPKSQRALPAEKLRDLAVSRWPEKNICCRKRIEEAIAYAFESSPDDAIICITGSNYLLGPARKALGLDDLPDDFVLSESFTTT
jgi:dihydrofolate synthase/folylpolyglutamate synthase